MPPAFTLSQDQTLQLKRSDSCEPCSLKEMTPSFLITQIDCSITQIEIRKIKRLGLGRSCIFDGLSNHPSQGAHTSHLRTLSKISHPAVNGSTRLQRPNVSSGEPHIIRGFSSRSTPFATEVCT